MIKLIIVILLIYFGNYIFAQQSFFNVPNSHITDKGELFFQQQSNVSAKILQFNETLCYGLGKGFEIGINHLGLTLNTPFRNPYFIANYDYTMPPIFPFLMLNAQKAIHINDNMEIATGILLGGNMADFNNFNEGIYAFTNFASKFEHTKTWFVGGIYYANKNYLGVGDRLFGKSPIGIQLGIEQFIYREKISLVIDYISGVHDFGESTFGFSYEFTSSFNMSVGYQLPNPNSNANQSLIVEFSLNRLTKRKSFSNAK